MSSNQEWRTPPDFWDVLNGQFDFQLDAAASKEDALCPLWIGKEQNALDVEWIEGKVKRVYCNPGFAKLEPWMLKANFQVQAVARGCVVVVMALVSPSTKWWNHWAVHASEIRLLAPRVQFKAPPGVKKTTNMKENCIVIFRSGHNGMARITTWKWKPGHTWR